MKKSLLIIPFLLVGCAKVSDYQASCEQRYQKLIRQPLLHERKKARKEWILHKLRELQALMHASIASMVYSALMMRKMQIPTSINISRTQQQSNQNHHLHLNRF